MERVAWMFGVKELLLAVVESTMFRMYLDQHFGRLIACLIWLREMSRLVLCQGLQTSSVRLILLLITIDAPIFVSQSGKVFARPTYYGMLAFSAIIGGSNSSVYRPLVNLYGTNTRLKAWAVYDSASPSITTYVIIHKDVGAPFTVTINSANTVDGTSAQVLELTSDALTDLNGFTLGNLSFPNPVVADYKESKIYASQSLFTLTAKPGTATIIRINSETNASPILSFA